MSDDFDFVSDLNDNGTDHSDTVRVADVDTSHVSDTSKIKVDQQQKPNAGDKPVSLRDQISSALKGDAEPTPEAQSGDMRARNPDGTFAAAVPDPQPQVPAGGQPSSSVTPPAGMDPQVFATLPAETQVQLARTMEHVNNQAARFAAYEQIEHTIAPRRQAWALNGMSEAQAVNQLFALSDFATTDPVGFVKYFAQNNGVDLEEVVFGEDPGDPELNALKQELANVKGQLNGFNQQQQHAQHTQTVDEVSDFFLQKDAGGNRLRPYAEEIGNSLTSYVELALRENPNRPRAEILQDGYERACWAIPSVRTKLQQVNNEAAEAERIRLAQERTSKARAAGSSVSSGVPTAAPTNVADGSLTLRDTIRASMNAG